ncbi:MAG: cysteine desulfurase family protein [Deferrisomatales bacterium]|nr:cysteine desulfurase family protein [Deferrisomatales bacterium]
MTAPGDRAYLDWNASAPLRAEARDALLAALDRFGNPSSPHREGREARALLESSREDVAALMGCEPGEVVFTSGGTEANNLALASLAAGARLRCFAAARLEHPSVLRPLEALVDSGWEARWMPLGEDGCAEPFVSAEVGFGVLQAANHETGALQPVGQFRGEAEEAGLPWHCDATQAWGRVPLRAGDLGCATASLSGHKLGAAKGVGALFMRRGGRVEPLLLGGVQERGRRAGTENLPGIASLAAACACAARDRAADAAWTQGLRDRVVSAVQGLVPLAWWNGPEDPARRLPNTASLSFPGIDGETLVQALDLEGVAVSAGTACASGAGEPSPVLAALGISEWRVRGAIRVSLGPTSRPEDVDRFLNALARVLPRLKGE